MPYPFNVTGTMKCCKANAACIIRIMGPVTVPPAASTDLSE